VDSDTTAHIATLLGAIERLRSERDNLRRDLNFLESENKFAVQALEAKIASVAPTVHENGQEQRIKSLTLAATASTIMVGHLQTQLEDVSADFASQLADTIRVSHADIKAAHRETKQALDQAKAQLSDLAKSLEEAESERDSLRLQVTNLESDLAMAQEELTEAEGRYSTLQTQQFSSMSSTEVARTLRQQIEELEMRVLRRTEQIGIHQHDIKRLETNLRLEEERLGEMTSELETLGEQKEAMVWDCADAREARDEAIRKCEGLEMELEALEGRLETSERERQQEVVTLIEVIAETTVRSRNILRRSVENNDSAAQALQATLALAVAHVELKSKSASLEVSNQAKADLQTKVEVLKEDLAKKVAEMKRLEQQLADLRQRSDANAISESQTIDQLRGEHSEQMATLQKMLDSTVYELQEAKAHHSDAEVHHQKVIEEASRSKTELESRLAAALERTQTVGQLKGELAKAHTDHAEEVNELQEQIRRDDEQLQEVIRSRAELETLHQTTATELTRTKEDYEAQLSKVTLLSSDTHRQLEDDLAAVKGQLEHSVDELKGLQIRLQEEIDARDRERQKHTLELQAKAEECRSAESLEAELHQEIAATRTQLDQTQTALQALEAEKSALQIETTNLGAEIQRTVSLNRFMESEIKAW
jgi:chromosome segregation ATPase